MPYPGNYKIRTVFFQTIKYKSMFTETSFEEWFAEVKTEFAKAGLTLPEDIEMMELAHMECMAEHKSMATFIQEIIKEQKGV